MSDQGLLQLMQIAHGQEVDKQPSRTVIRTITRTPALVDTECSVSRIQSMAEHSANMLSAILQGHLSNRKFSWQ